MSLRLPAVALLLFASLLPVRPAQASPFSPASVDSAIANCAAQISADSLLAYLVKLQSFQTRHTNSDTTSATVGIGAARRWLHAKFTEIGNATGNLNVSYHTFTATISGVNTTHRNVIAEIPGTAPENERRIYILGAHLDSRQEDVDIPDAPQYGVDDDGSGIACLLECARIMAAKSWPMTIRFVGFTGEEQGLEGSARYALSVKVSNEPLKAMIANDIMASIIGAPHPDSTAFSDTTLARIFASNPEQGPHRQVQRYLKAIGDLYVPIQNLVLIPAEDRPGRGSDHLSFVDNGFPAIRFMEYLEELDKQHTALGDTLGDHLSMSYLRRNCQIDLATLGHLAKSPASPLGLAVGDVGDSTAFRLTWPDTNDEPNLVSYLVTARTPGSLDYQTVTAVGMVNEFVVTSPPAASMYFGLSVVDTQGHRALIAEEVLGVLSSVPGAPNDLAANADGSAIHLTWAANPESDLAGYKVYRSTTPGGGYVLQTPIPVGSPAYNDGNAAPHTFYYYVVTAVDDKAKESAFSDEVRSRLATMDSGILFVDETKNNGNTAWFPSDAVSDPVYAAMTAGLPHATWDVDLQDVPTPEDLGIYSSIIWVADDFNGTFQGFPLITQRLRDAASALAGYMNLGGNVMLAGWEPTRGFDPLLDYPFTLGPGDFLYDYFGVQNASIDVSRRFTGGVGQAFFPNVTLEPTRLNPAWSGKLSRAEYLTAIANGASVGYRFNSTDPDSAYHLQPCATIRNGGNYRAVYWGFPLYHLKTAEAKAALEAAMTYFGELASTAVGDQGLAALEFALGQNRPNPFTNDTQIRFSVPSGGARVTVSIYDVAGRRVRELLSAKVDGGVHTVTWDGADDSGLKTGAGVYFYRLESTERKLTKKLVRLH